MTRLRWDPHRVENPMVPGMPDINCIYGWFELKFVPQWPAREATVLDIAHFTQEQRVWLASRCRAHGAGGFGAWVFLQVGTEYLVFDGETASIILGRADRQQLIDRALGYWKKFPTADEFVEVIVQ